MDAGTGAKSDNGMTLTKPECEAVMDYIYQHARTAAPNGKAFKVWQKMFDFVTSDQQELNFRAVKKVDNEQICLEVRG